MDGEPIRPTKPYSSRLDALRVLEKHLHALDVPTYMIFDFPQMASSFDNDPYQPVLLVGDLRDTRDVKCLYSDTRRCWYFAVGSWRNDRGGDPCQVAVELATWWAGGTRA